MCARDILFWVNTFIWISEPRGLVVNGKNTGIRLFPVTTYPFQDDAIVRLRRAIGRYDVGVPKSRDMGASWMCLLAFLHAFQFERDVTLLLGSRNESYVDRAGNPKALFQKLDVALEHQPSWLRPRFSRSQLHIGNLDNGSVIDGESNTADIGRGDRRTALLLDEFAAFDIDIGYKALGSTRDMTNCRIFNSTYQGTGNAFYDVMQLPHLETVSLHWTLHPEKNRGLYTTQSEGGGSPLLLDDKYDYPDDYPFVLDGRVRSPWYDAECRRTPIRAEIGQELDMEPIASGSQFFDETVIQSHMKQNAMPPFKTGRIEIRRNASDAAFVEEPRGGFRIWCHLDAYGKPPPGRYAVGSDVSMGSGASNSALSVVNRMTGEKVAEWATPFIRPEFWAEYLCAVGHWFHEGFLVIEATGPGHACIDRVWEIGYRNLYYQYAEHTSTRRRTDKPGWWTSRDATKRLLTQYHRDLARNQFVNRSESALAECRRYVHTPDGGVEHARRRGVAQTLDPSGARENHGDQVIADALADRGRIDRPVETKTDEDDPPVGSIAYRRKMARRQEMRDPELAGW